MKRGGVRRFLQRSDGGAAIEFALIASFVVLPLLSGLVDVGLWLREQAKVNQVTREVAQAAMRTRNTDVLRELLDRSISKHGITPETKKVSCICPGDKKPKCESLDPSKCATSSIPWQLVIEIEVVAEYHTIFNFWNLDLPESKVQVQVR
jgi:Flp pilus assembly pilin Flp